MTITSFAAIARERAKIEGIALRRTTFVALVPANMTFDRQLALNDAAAPAAAEGEKKGGGLRGMLGRVQKMADEANKKSDKPAAPGDHDDRQDRHRRDHEGSSRRVAVCAASRVPGSETAGA